MTKRVRKSSPSIKRGVARVVTRLGSVESKKHSIKLRRATGHAHRHKRVRS